MTSNLRKVTPELANQVNVMELMNTQAVLISKDGLKKLEETCKN
jgi:ribosomal protein L4